MHKFQRATKCDARAIANLAFSTNELVDPGIQPPTSAVSWPDESATRPIVRCIPTSPLLSSLRIRLFLTTFPTYMSQHREFDKAIGKKNFNLAHSVCTHCKTRRHKGKIIFTCFVVKGVKL